MDLFIYQPYKKIDKWYKLEEVALAHNICNGEAALFNSKYKDYKTIHPVNANILFFELYKFTYKMCYRKYVDFQESIVKRGAKKDYLYDNDNKTIAAINKARIQADKYGIPYGLWCSITTRVLIEGHKWKHIPLPVHLYSEDIIPEVLAEWQDYKNFI